MQILAVGLFNAEGDRRDVDFAPGKLNILTGRSKTGKSALLEIVDFCLGRDTFTVPVGAITEAATWFYVLLQFPDSRMLICRPKPAGKGTSLAMVSVGGQELGKPAFADLAVNTDTDVLRTELSSRIGIEKFRLEVESYSLGYSHDVSVRQALFYCFQSQGEIANRELLFHRQGEFGVAPSIRIATPYFLGAATPEQATLRQALLSTRRNIRRLERDLGELAADREALVPRVAAIAQTAQQIGALESDQLGSLAGSPRELLTTVLEVSALDIGLVPPEATTDRLENEAKIRALRDQIRHVDEELDLLRRIEEEHDANASEVRFQSDRLRALDLIAIDRDASQSPTDVCPFCEQLLPAPDPTAGELNALALSLSARLESGRALARRRDEAAAALSARREQLVVELREASRRLDASAGPMGSDVPSRSAGEDLAFLQGRAQQELERLIDAPDLTAQLTAQLITAKSRAAQLEELLEADDPDERLRRAVDAVSQQITFYARRLGLEASSEHVRLDLSELTVVVQQPGGQIPLSRLGSAENWVGYHLATHLALHHWFAVHNRPVPRFLMLDQPTQAFFPEEIADATEHEDADWDAVRRQFELMRDVVDSLDGSLQVIVCDHANLNDAWFQDSLVENWRQGLALIPAGWLDK